MVAFADKPIRVHSSTSKTPYPRQTNAMLSTKYFDDETELVYFGYRYYSPEMGRWISRDPIGEWGRLDLRAFVGDSGVLCWSSSGLLYCINVAPHFYGFVGNEPLAVTDALGLQRNEPPDTIIIPIPPDDGADDGGDGSDECCDWSDWVPGPPLMDHIWNIWVQPSSGGSTILVEQKCSCPSTATGNPWTPSGFYWFEIADVVNGQAGSCRCSCVYSCGDDVNGLPGICTAQVAPLPPWPPPMNPPPQAPYTPGPVIP